MLHVRPVNTLPNIAYWLRYLTAGPQNQRCFQGRQPLAAPAFTSAIQRFRSVSASKYMASSSADLTQTRLQKTAQFAIRDQKCPWTFMDTNKLGLKLTSISSWKRFFSCLPSFFRSNFKHPSHVKGKRLQGFGIVNEDTCYLDGRTPHGKNRPHIGGRTKQSYDTNQWGRASYPHSQAGSATLTLQVTLSNHHDGFDRCELAQ